MPDGANSLYPNLLAPLKVGSKTLRNRCIMASMHTRMEMLDRSVERDAAFYGARAHGGASMVVTGGRSPNDTGYFEPGAPAMFTEEHAEEHKPIAAAIQAGGALACLQVLHAGRYAKIPNKVGASSDPSRINPGDVHALTTEEVAKTVEDFAQSALLAQKAGFDAVEIMGSEGYLITQLTCPRTNNRDDEWGGSLENRLRFPLEIVKRTRELVGPDMVILYRISALDLVEGGLNLEDTQTLARALEQAGADMLTTGVGWHEARVPTIAHMVPRAAWRFSARGVKDAVSIPVVATNRINMPDIAEDVIASGDADVVGLGRSFLADPEFMNKAAEGRADEINTCIACNQACLDNIFGNATATCLVNPRAGRELDIPDGKAEISKTVAVIGSGPAGMSVAVTAAERGHKVTIFEAAAEIGGQLNMAKRIPGKSEFYETIRYFRRRSEVLGIDLRLNTRATPDMIAEGGFEEVVVATGVHPRELEIEGIGHSKVLRYTDVLADGKPVGDKVAIIGAGGIGYDMAVFLTGGEPKDDPAKEDIGEFMKHWGIDPTHATDSGLIDAAPAAGSSRQVTLMQRTPKRMGTSLGLTTGWVLRDELKRTGVAMIPGVTYEKIDDDGLHISIDSENGAEKKLLDVDNVIICAGQESARELYDALIAQGTSAHIIGGAEMAAELDALRAIDQGLRLAISL